MIEPKPTRNCECRGRVGGCAIQDTPLDGLGLVAVAGLPLRGAPRLALWIRLRGVRQLVDPECVGGYRWSGRCRVLLYTGLFDVLRKMWLVYLISLNMWCCGRLIIVSDVGTFHMRATEPFMVLRPGICVLGQQLH